MQTKLLLLSACTALGTGNTSWPRFPHLQIGTCDHFPAPLEARIWRRVKQSCPPSTLNRRRVSLFLPRLSQKADVALMLWCAGRGRAWCQDQAHQGHAPKRGALAGVLSRAPAQCKFLDCFKQEN